MRFVWARPVTVGSRRLAPAHCHGAEVAKRARPRAPAKPVVKRSPQAIAILLAVLIVGSPLGWWLTQTPDRAVRVLAECRTLALTSSNALYLKPNGVSDLMAHGFVGEIDRARTIKVSHPASGQALSLSQSSLALNDPKLGGTPTSAMRLRDKAGRFMVELGRTASIGTTKYLLEKKAVQVAGAQISLMFESEGLTINANRMTISALAGVYDFKIDAENPDDLVLLALKSGESSDPTLQLGFGQTASFRLEYDATSRLQTTFSECPKLDVAVDDEKLALPTMSLNDLTMTWSRSSATESSFPAGEPNPAGVLSFAFNGDSSSLVYNGKQLAATNLRMIVGLSAEKQGGLGLLVLGLLWVAKQIIERISKLILDRVLPEKKKKERKS